MSRRERGSKKRRAGRERGSKKRRARRERSSEEEDGEEGEREAVMKRKGEKGSEEDDYFNKFPRQCLQWFLKID